jgi:pyruvate dehydrogenase E2 component (dihydrolipoamide acetyltransferase)
MTSTGAGAVPDAGAARQPLSPMRRAIAATMTLSAQIPQFTLTRTVPFDAVDRERSRLKRVGANVSYQDFVVAAVAAALTEHRALNASFDGDAIVTHAGIHVGIAIALPDGLVSPAIIDADRRSVVKIAAERRRLTRAVHDGLLGGRELYGATFSVSNLGPYGVESFEALVIPPQAAILALGAVSGDTLGLRASVSLSCDHRVVDGVPAAAFLASFVAALANPDHGADADFQTDARSDSIDTTKVSR